MNKVATYLQGHVVGEVSTRNDDRMVATHDGSILELKPEMVVYPRTTNDLRKLTRFAWQLAEKGHTLTVHARGAGHDSTGASLGGGIVVDVSRHMTTIYEYESKQRLVRLQPGTTITSLTNALRLQGTGVAPLVGLHGTVGGAVASDASGRLVGKFGPINTAVSQLEIVLDSGDVLQTERISKRELNRRKGLQGREGDIYRGIDAVLEDHASLIEQLQNATNGDRSGYAGIIDVKQKNGSFDLTPLLVGSQGTLGIISEMILRAEFLPNDLTRAVVMFEDATVARQSLDALRKLVPASLEYIDGTFLAAAAAQGGSYTWLTPDANAVAALVVIGFDEFSERNAAKRLKKLTKALAKQSCTVFIPSNTTESELIRALEHDLVGYVVTPADGSETSSPDILTQVYVPAERFEEFAAAVDDMSAALHMPILLHGSVGSGLYAVRPRLSLHKVGDKQKIFKLIDQVGALADGLGGSLVGAGGEGQLLARYVRAIWLEEYVEMVDEIKQVFDPHGIFNPAAKTDVELKQLVNILRSSTHKK